MRTIWPNPPFRPILAAQHIFWQLVRRGIGLAKWVAVIWPNPLLAKTPRTPARHPGRQATGANPHHYPARARKSGVGSDQNWER